jgi:hypothetical protein
LLLTPFPVFVVEVFNVVVVGRLLFACTHTHVSSHRPAQLLPTYGFQARNCAKLMPYRVLMVWQSSPLTTKWKPVQSVVMPSRVGVGVLIPLPDVVVEVVEVVVVPELMTPTHRYVFSQRDWQMLPMAGFQATSWAVVTPYWAPMDVQPSPLETRWNLLQFLTMPSWIGVGVLMPFPVVVVVGGEEVVVVPPMTPTQTYVLSHMD